MLCCCRDNDTSPWAICDTTEWQGNNHDPDFQTEMVLRYHSRGDDREVGFVLYDVDKSTNSAGDIIGRCHAPIAAVLQGKGFVRMELHSTNRLQNKKLAKAGAHLQVRFLGAPDCRWVGCHFEPV